MISDKAIVSKEVHVGSDVTIMPLAVIEEGVWIGQGTIVQPFAYIEKNCRIGRKCRIGTGAVLREGTKIGHHSIFGCQSLSEGNNEIGNHTSINTGCLITIGVVVGDYVFVGPKCITMNTKNISHGRKNIVPKLEPSMIKDKARVGAGVKLLPSVVIGENAFVGAGSVVTHDVKPKTVVYGNPARFVRNVNKEELL